MRRRWGADGDAAVGADFGLGALAPDVVGPPGAVWSGAQGGALFLQSQIPCGLRGGAQFAVAFFLVGVNAKFFEQRVGLGQGGDVLGGEERREALLPKIMRALDLALGLGGGRVTQRDFVEAQGGAELGESLRLAGEIEGVIVHVGARGGGRGRGRRRAGSRDAREGFRARKAARR